jgi:hypothetical protein
MSRLTMPVLVRLLLCGALVVLGASMTPSSQWSSEGNSSAATHLPATNSFSGYIIAVG